MKRLVKVLRLADDLLAVVETALVVLGLLLMVGLAFAQIALKQLGKGGVVWFPVVTRHLVLWVAMLGASLAARDRRHISVEIVSKLVTAQGRRVVEGIVDFGTIVVCVFLALVAWEWLEFQEMPEDFAEPMFVIERGPDEPPLRIMRWWSLLVVPAAFLLIAFRYARLWAERIFIDEPVDPLAEERRELEEYDRKHESGERPGAGDGDAAAGPGPQGASP